MRYVVAIGWIILPAVLSACGLRGGEDIAPSGDEFSVLSWNLHHYGLIDRDGDGRWDDEKPARERRAVIRVIAAYRPDILVVQEMGNPDIFRRFREALAREGLRYPHSEYYQRERSEHNLAILSRYPITGRFSHTNDFYSIGRETVPVARGFPDVEITVRDYRFRLLTAHLKSKVFHPLGQTEMRRNEARLLGNHVRDILDRHPDGNVLVAGDLNDHYSAALLDGLLGEDRRLLHDLRPADVAGAVWTHFQRSTDVYSRFDYLLISRPMLAEAVREKCRVLSGEDVYEGSDHRPLYAVFKARERKIAVRNLDLE